MLENAKTEGGPSQTKPQYPLARVRLEAGSLTWPRIPPVSARAGTGHWTVWKGKRLGQLAASASAQENQLDSVTSGRL